MRWGRKTHKDHFLRQNPEALVISWIWVMKGKRESELDGPLAPCFSALTNKCKEPGGRAGRVARAVGSVWVC